MVKRRRAGLYITMSEIVTLAEAQEMLI